MHREFYTRLISRSILCRKPLCRNILSISDFHLKQHREIRSGFWSIRLQKPLPSFPCLSQMRSEPVGSFRISFLPATEGAFTGSPFVAEPGTSEHQSGLALDVSCPSIHMELSERFSATGEGRWLKKNAPLYGFILRYPKSKEEITGIPYEPWHIRYVTKPLASWLTITNLTLEEYHCFPSRCPHPP